MLIAAGINATFSIPKTDDTTEGQVELLETAKVEAAAEVKVTKELSPEDAALTLRTLETRFKANNHLHEGCYWGRVKKALEANPEALWSIAQMEVHGHKPDVYNFDDKGFDIGTCSEETPEIARNCVYDAEAVEWLKENRSDEKFNGSAVEMAEAMGIELMPPLQYRDVLQGNGKFDMQTRSWLLTDKATREAGRVGEPGAALYGGGICDEAYVRVRGASVHDADWGWRGSLRVNWT